MTKEQFTTWLRRHFPRGAASINRTAFIAAFNAEAAKRGAPVITLAALNMWQHRRPPGEWGGMPFSDFLRLIEPPDVQTIEVPPGYEVRLVPVAGAKA